MSLFGWEDAPPTITPVDAAAKLHAGDATLIDVGRAHEWIEGHLQGARLEPLDFAIDRADLPRDRTLIVGCRETARGAEIVVGLRNEGYDACLLGSGPHEWASTIGMVVTPRPSHA